MDGFRAAPAALEEDRLLPMLKNLDQEVKAEIEAVLKKDGFYSGEPEGYFRPEARAALAAWTKAKGPLPEAEIPVEKPPAVRPALPDVPADILNTALHRAFDKVEAAKSDAEWAEALAMVAPLARLGEPISRWALVRWYDQSPVVGEAVTPEELTRYAFDILLLKDPQMEQAEMEVIFALTELWKANQGQAFADGFLAVLRDDERLQDKLVLEEVLYQLVFIPGACDMLLAGARERGVEGLPEDPCNSKEARDILLEFALAAGPSGVESGGPHRGDRRNLQDRRRTGPAIGNERSARNGPSDSPTLAPPRAGRRDRSRPRRRASTILRRISCCPRSGRITSTSRALPVGRWSR